MIQPQELEVWYVIPSIRKGFAQHMLKKGLSQKEIAKKLRITEAAISYYLKNKRAKELKFDKHINKEIGKSADRIIKNSDLLMKEIQRICKIVKITKVLCKLHRKHDKHLAKECSICK
ncbi:helix-turn-helix domain-containing protein [archaeon]|nr:helix-turn-helix domain-containing protein [archaeon]